MLKTIFSICVLLFGAAHAHAQKQKTIVGDSWIGTVESLDEATREIRLVNPNKPAQTFVGVLINPFIVKMKDGAVRELKFSEIKIGQRFRAFYTLKTENTAGKKNKLYLIDELQFLGHDDYTRLRELLKVDPSLPVTLTNVQKLTANDPLKLYLAIQPKTLRESMVEWADQRNKKHSAKDWGVELVDDPAKSDASVVVIWGEDDSYIRPELQMHRPGDMVSSDRKSVSAQVTIYVTTKDENGIHVLWQRSRMIVVLDPKVDVPIVVRDIENKLKDLRVEGGRRGPPDKQTRVQTSGRST
jgi:hypothetical protein